MQASSSRRQEGRLKEEEAAATKAGAKKRRAWATSALALPCSHAALSQPSLPNPAVTGCSQALARRLSSGRRVAAGDAGDTVKEERKIFFNPLLPLSFSCNAQPPSPAHAACVLADKRMSSSAQPPSTGAHHDHGDDDDDDDGKALARAPPGALAADLLYLSTHSSLDALLPSTREGSERERERKSRMTRGKQDAADVSTKMEGGVYLLREGKTDDRAIKTSPS